VQRTSGNLEIPGSRFARPGMTNLACPERGAAPVSRVAPTCWPVGLIRDAPLFELQRTGWLPCLTGKSVNPVQPPLQKYFCSSLTQITSISPTVPPHRGALAIVIDAGRDAVDAAAFGTQRDRRAR
jgi:hypothetical protein